MTHVLVVEDTQLAADMCAVLQELGRTTERAEDGAVALECLLMDADKFQLIIMPCVHSAGVSQRAGPRARTPSLRAVSSLALFLSVH